MGKLGNYDVKPGKSELVDRIARRLKEIDVNPANGDAVYYMGRIRY
jgi:hypothetical protein